MRTPIFLEDLEPGLLYESPGRTITETDVVQFACLTGDFNEVHTNQEAAVNGVFGQRVAHGLLGLAYSAGLSSRLPFGSLAVQALLGIRDWSFNSPIAIGDTIRLRTWVESTRSTRAPGRGVVEIKRQLVNHRDAVVQEGIVVLLVATRPVHDHPASK